MKTTQMAGLLALLLGGCQTGGEAKPPATATAPSAPSADWMAPPSVPAALAVPPGATLKLHAHGAGAQIYTCGASGWALKAPDAKLSDAGGAPIGTHGAGPTWTANDGSAAVAKKIAEAPAPAPDAIPWLLLQVTSNRGAGTFSDVTYVQRLATAGGKAPADGCDAGAQGTTREVSYTAEYYLYAGATAQAVH